MIVVSDAPAQPAFAKSSQLIALDNHNTILVDIAAHHSPFRESGAPFQEPVRCYAARADASFRYNPLLHRGGPSSVLGPLSLVTPQITHPNATKPGICKTYIPTLY